VQALADLRIRQTLGDESNNAQLLAAQLRFLSSARIDQHGRGAWIDHAFACKHPLDRSAQIEVLRISDEEAARTGVAKREELVGSTITVSSLGKLGGIASTPIINAPEVAIVGVNRAVERPVVIDGAIAVRRMMNLSSSFDHRFVDGYDAAAMVQALKERLEHPATLFLGH